MIVASRDKQELWDTRIERLTPACADSQAKRQLCCQRKQISGEGARPGGAPPPLFSQKSPDAGRCKEVDREAQSQGHRTSSTMCCRAKPCARRSKKDIDLCQVKASCLPPKANPRAGSHGDPRQNLSTSLPADLSPRGSQAPADEGHGGQGKVLPERAWHPIRGSASLPH
jgi:hypothetical protein